MKIRWLATALLTATSTAALAQSMPSPTAADVATVRLAQARTAVPVVEEDEISPRQIQQENRPRSQRPATAAAGNTGTTAPTPAARPARPAAARPAAEAATAATNPAAAKPSPSTRAIACTGVFGRESTHLKLAIAFDSRNLAYSEVDGPEGTKLNASVLFPNDPKRRLEVLWQNEASRADTSLIVINGQSQWTAPKGLRIGMPIAALEKANGKPFTIAGLDQDNGGSAIDWKGGALASLPGGCKIGVRLGADPKAKDDARAAAAGKEFESNDAAIKAARLSIVEIILGY
jgi:hypothetical protein